MRHQSSCMEALLGLFPDLPIEVADGSRNRGSKPNIPLSAARRSWV